MLVNNNSNISIISHSNNLVSQKFDVSNMGPSMKLISLCIQTISAGLYKSSYFMNKIILSKPLVSRFSLLLRLRSYKLSKFYISNINFFNINLIVNKRVRVLIFLFRDSRSSYLQHL